MITVKIGNLIDFEQSTEFNNGEVYVLRNEKEVLYVGITNRGIQARWLAQFGGHLMRNAYGQLTYGSQVGRYIMDNMPDADNWTLESWMVKECVEFIDDEVLNRADPKLITAEWVEPAMIRKLEPALNSMYSISKRHMLSDERLEEMRQAHRKIFG